MITTPDGDIAEDRIVTAVGSYSASATLSGAGAWVMQMVAFKAAGGVADTTPPTAPTGLAATRQWQQRHQSELDGVDRQRGGDRVSGGALPGRGLQQLCAGRDAERDDVRRHRSAGRHQLQLPGAGDRCGGQSERVFERGERDHGGAPDTHAADGADGADGDGAVAAAAINLSWTASTDNVGVTGYRVERCQGAGCSTFAQVGTPTGTTFGDTGLLAGTSYSYRVRATDAAGNLSAYSNTASATTAAAPDTTPPTAPTGLTATAAVAAAASI